MANRSARTILKIVATIPLGMAAVTSSHGQDVVDQLPQINAYAPSENLKPMAPAPKGTIVLEAKLTPDSAPIDAGMVWRVFGAIPDFDGKLPLIAQSQGGTARLNLEPGDYLIHATFGRASASSRIYVNEGERSETFVLNAGGLRLDATLPDGSAVRRDKLTFDIFETSATDGEQVLVLPKVPAGRTIRLPAGTYHVVSNYGDLNATIRADLRVEPGKTTAAQIEHRAAQVTLNLVRADNGFPLADTAWTILGSSGDTVKEEIGAYPTMILAAGEYTAIARHRDQIYQTDFSVAPGRDRTIRIDISKVAPESDFDLE